MNYIPINTTFKKAYTKKENNCITIVKRSKIT